jgi:hypothetical protein
MLGTQSKGSQIQNTLKRIYLIHFLQLSSIFTGKWLPLFWVTGCYSLANKNSPSSWSFVMEQILQWCGLAEQSVLNMKGQKYMCHPHDWLRYSDASRGPRVEEGRRMLNSHLKKGYRWHHHWTPWVGKQGGNLASPTCKTLQSLTVLSLQFFLSF